METAALALPASFLAHLARLADHLGGDSDQLTAAATDLVADLDAALHGYAGLQLTVLHTGHPVTLTLLPPELVKAVVTSVRVSLTLLASHYERGGRIVLYGTVPGALVDLGEDLRFALKPVSGPDGARSAGLDGDGDGERRRR